MAKLSAKGESKPTGPSFDPTRKAWLLPSWNDKATVETFRTQVTPLLTRALGAFWEGQTGGGYSLIEDTVLCSVMTNWLEKQYIIPRKGPIAPYPINSRRLEELLEMLRTICHQEIKQTGVDLNTKKSIPVIPLQDIMYNPTTKELLKYEANHFITWKLPFSEEVLRHAKCEKWIEFLRQGFKRDEDIALLQEWFGYCLNPVSDLQRCLWLYGLRGSGKTVITKILCAMLGEDNIWAGTARDLGAKFNSDVRNKRLLLLPDFRVRDADNASGLQFILNVVGGDHVRIEAKNKDSISILLNCWVMFHSNELPAFSDSTGAALRRIIPLHRTGTWEKNQDPRLTDKLLEELPGIFGWALRGFDRLIERGDFDQKMFDQKLLDNSARTTNPVIAFVQDCCVVHTGDSREGTFISIEELFSYYQKWCIITRTKMNYNQELFTIAMMQSVITLKRSNQNNKRGFQGILMTQLAREELLI